MLIARLVLLLMNIQVSIPTENFCSNHAVRNKILTKGECMLSTRSCAIVIYCFENSESTIHSKKLMLPMCTEVYFKSGTCS